MKQRCNKKIRLADQLICRERQRKKGKQKQKGMAKQKHKKRQKDKK